MYIYLYLYSIYGSYETVIAKKFCYQKFLWFKITSLTAAWQEKKLPCFGPNWGHSIHPWIFSQPLITKTNIFLYNCLCPLMDAVCFCFFLILTEAQLIGCLFFSPIGIGTKFCNPTETLEKLFLWQADATMATWDLIEIRKTRAGAIWNISREMKENAQIIYPSIVLKDMLPSSWTLTGPWMACYRFLHPTTSPALVLCFSNKSLQISIHLQFAGTATEEKTPENCKLLNFLFFVTCDTNVTSSHPALPISTTTAPRAASYIADRRTSWCVSITANAIRVLPQLSAWSVIQCSVIWNRVVSGS